MLDNSGAAAGIVPARISSTGPAARKVLQAVGIDRAVGYTLLGRGCSVVSGFLTIGFIARSLRPEEQGFYYTFGSVIALYLFCELGLGFVMVQFASHEKAHLEWTSESTLRGDDRARLRLAAMLKSAVRWYGGAIFLVLALVLPAGLLFFSQSAGEESNVVWKTPWIAVASGSALNLLTTPFFATLEGCGKISEIALARTCQNVAANIGVWLTLSFGGGLFAVGVFQVTYFMVGMVWLATRYRRFVVDLLRLDTREAPFNWRTEVWPFQWRIAVSWISNYLALQIFNPVLFAARGPVAAGQMGMTLSVSTALLNASMAWMTTKASPLGVLVARRQWPQLDKLFFRTFRQSATAFATSAAVVACGAAILHAKDVSLAQRLLPPAPMAMFLLSAMFNQIVMCLALYLRTHKTEPFVWLSLLSATAAAGATIVLAKPFGPTGIAFACVLCSFVSAIVGAKIFVERRREWHAEERPVDPK